MPDLAGVLKEEIRRLARKEVRAAIANLRKDNAVLKRVAADHKRRLAKVERENRQLMTDAVKRREEALPASEDEVRSARITGKTIRGIRAKLKLSQADFAKLVAVSSQTVHQWERKEGRLTFRGNAKAAIVELRKLDRKEAQQRVEAISEDKTMENTTATTKGTMVAWPRCAAGLKCLERGP